MALWCRANYLQALLDPITNPYLGPRIGCTLSQEGRAITWDSVPCPPQAWLQQVPAAPQGLNGGPEMAQLSRSYGTMVTGMLFRSLVPGGKAAFAFKWRFGSL